MNKLSLIIFVVIIAVFGGILYMNQRNSVVKTASEIPTLPPESIALQLLSPSPAQTAQGQQNAQPAVVDEMGPPKASVSAVLRTTKGTITISLVLKDAPNAINNFVTKAKSGFYNDLKFHRVEDWVIQGGDPTGTGNGGKPIQTELNAKPFTVGSVGFAASNQMAIGKGARISNDSQFFIVTQEANWLDGQYTNFGTVTGGMDVANKIQIGDKILGITIR